MDQSVLLRLAEGGSKAANCTSFTATEVEVAVQNEFFFISLYRQVNIMEF